MNEPDSLSSVPSVCVSSLLIIFVFLQEAPKGYRRPDRSCDWPGKYAELYIYQTLRFQVVLFRLPGFFWFSSYPTCPTLLSALPCPREYPGWMYKVVSITYSYVAHLRDTETVRSRKPLTIYNSMAFYCLRAGAGPDPLW